MCYYQSALRNVPEEQRSLLHRGGSLKLRIDWRSLGRNVSDLYVEGARFEHRVETQVILIEVYRFH
jgi:hypothetical protein